MSSAELTQATVGFDADKATRFAKSLLQIVVLLMALVAMTASPESVQAQSAAYGKFTLATTTRIGAVELPAGEYKYDVTITSSLPLLNVRSLTTTAGTYIFPTAIVSLKDSAPDKLTLKEANGELYVSSLAVKELGVELIYAAPKTKAESAKLVPAKYVQAAK